MCSTIQKFRVGSIRFFFFLMKEVTYAHQDCIYWVKNAVKTVAVLQL